MKYDTKYLTSIRGLACLMVVIAHILANIPSIGINVSGCGKIGVWLFFILSAFLLTGQWIKIDKFTGKSVIQFYIKRFFRIFPCYIVTLIIAFGIGYIDKISIVIKHIFLLDGVGHFWIIPVEFIFYLFVPIIAFIIYKINNKKKSIIFLIILGIISEILSPYWNCPENSINLRWYLPVFILGMITAFIYKELESREIHSIKCDIMIGVILLGMICSVPYVRKIIFNIEPDRYLQNKYLYFGLAWSMIILLIQNSKYIIKLLNGSKILYWFGNISFSLYLVHFIVLNQFNFTNNILVNSIFVFIVSVVIAAIMNRWIEQPGIKISKKLIVNFK